MKLIKEDYSEVIRVDNIKCPVWHIFYLDQSQYFLMVSHQNSSFTNYVLNQSRLDDIIC